jgi:hypothetical protein
MMKRGPFETILAGQYQNVGFVRDLENYLSQGRACFPSQCEGSAKVTYEAAACGFPKSPRVKQETLLMMVSKEFLLRPETWET